MRSKGFTLLELLVVIAIIAVLISLLVPSINNALERGREVKCQSNLRNIVQAMLAFAADHNGHLPGSAGPGRVPGDSWRRSFMGTEVVNEKYRSLIHSDMDANRLGSLASYLGIAEGEKTTIYRCPSHEAGVPGSGVGSNGMFDYAMILHFGGVRLSAIPRQTVFYREQPGEQRIATPLIVEEDPVRINWVNMEPGYGNVDRIGSWHRGGKSFYASVDGGVFAIQSTTGVAPIGLDLEVRVGDRWYGIAEPRQPGISWGKLHWD